MPEAGPQERELVERARGGDGRAFAALVRAHEDAVFRLCARHAGRADAEEIAQETFLRAFVHREKLDPAQGVRSWLLSIAHRICIDRFRTRRDFMPIDVEDHVAPQLDPDARIDAQASVAKLEIALKRLSPGQRESIMLFHVEGLAYADVARTLGVPIGTVMSWLHRGREKLREALGAEAVS